MPHSDFEQIGVRSYNWVWSKDAVKLGVSGTGHGVIAQEVEEMYPWTVFTGNDGYKRVDYEALKQMVMEKKTDYCLITQRYGTNRHPKSYEYT